MLACRVRAGIFLFFSMSIIYLDKPLFDSVAVVNRSTGVIMVNAAEFEQYTPFEQRFILLHEEAHYRLNTDDEFTCDAYAFERMAGTEHRSLKQLVATVERALPFTTPEHRERLNAQIRRALEWDYKHTGNKAAARALKRMRNGYSALDSAENALLTAVADDINNRNATSTNGLLSNFNKLTTAQKIGGAGAVVLGIFALLIITR